MAQERETTPEKQLLKLIENPNAKSAGVQGQVAKHHSLGLFSFGAWISRFSFFKAKAAKWARGNGFRQSDVRIINRVLSVCLFALILYFIIGIVASIINMRKMPDFGIERIKGTGAAGVQKGILLKAASFYLEKARERNIFEMGLKEAPVDTEEEDTAKAPSAKTLEAVQYLKLVGISWSEDPDIMIEDTRALRTFFLKRGETIGEFKVQAIFKDKVILDNDEGEEIELR